MFSAQSKRERQGEINKKAEKRRGETQRNSETNKKAETETKRDKQHTHTQTEVLFVYVRLRGANSSGLMTYFADSTLPDSKAFFLATSNALVCGCKGGK